MLQPVEFEVKNVVERLMRTNQNYKTNVQHAINTGNTNFNLLEQINSIDYLQDWSRHTSSFDVQLSFTVLDWLIADLVNSGNPLNL